MADTFFGLQLAIEAPPGDEWLLDLCGLLRQYMRDLSLADKRGFYGSLSNLLLQASDRITFGFWDLIDNGSAEFDEWASGIEYDSAEPWVADRSGARMDHILVSAVFLLQGDGPSEELARRRCDLPEAQWRDRATFVHLIETMAQFSYASVRSDACYITPGGDDAAFSRRELQEEGYDYLLAID